MHRTDATRLLGVGPTPSADEVRRAFRRHLALAHPDRGGDPAQVQRLVEARDLLLEHQPGPDPERPRPLIVRRRRRRVDLVLDRLLGGRRPPRDLV